MIVKEEIKGCKLWNVPLGGLFKHGDRFFIKTCTSTLCPIGSTAFTAKMSVCPEEDHHVNCVDVKSGYYTYIDDYAFVEYFPDAFISVGESKKMKIKENKKQNEKKISEIKPGTLFKYGDLYFIRTSDTVYQHRSTMTGISLSCNSCPEYNFDNWYEPIEAICVSDGRPRSFKYCELVEVFPDAFISVEDE